MTKEEKTLQAGELIEKIKIRQGITFEELGLRIGSSGTYLNRIYNGKLCPSITLLNLLIMLDSYPGAFNLLKF